MELNPLYIGPEVDAARAHEPQWTDAVDGVSAAALPSIPGAALQLCRIPVGGRLPLHDAPAPVFIAVLSGRGTIGMSDGSQVRYAAPTIIVCQPGAPHDWHDIEQDTLLAVCTVG